MADLQIFWVPTAVAMKGYAEELDCSSTESDIARKTLDHQLSQIAQGRELGVPVVIGTDSGSLGVNHGKAFVDEMKLLMDAGFTLEETISCASMEGARLLGLRSSLGQIKKGMPASFVVCKGEPAFLPDSLRFPERVFVMGIELKGGIAGNGDVSRK
jgi:imidazolonepropionase-like amidohydrolase